MPFRKGFAKNTRTTTTQKMEMSGLSLFQLNDMGKFNDGIFGSFSGRVGKVVGANWRGIDVLRKRPRRKPNCTGTEGQLKYALH